MSGGCFEGVWKMSNMCLAGINIVCGFWKVSEGIRRVSGRCLESIWNVSGIRILT